jgi:hypothetical protein
MKFSRIACVLLVTAVSIPACNGRPTAEDRDNRRVLDQILTAITLKNTRLLEESAERAAERHADGHLSDDDYQGIAEFIARGRQGDWQSAEAEGYAFRREHPFVKPGQR